MSVVGTVVPRTAGMVHRQKVLTLTATGPAADVIVPAGGNADVTISVDTGIDRPAQEMGIRAVTGLPAGVYIAAITVDPVAKTVTLTLHNPGAADVTVTANSVSVTLVVVN